MVTILSGAVERGTAKKLKSLNVPLAGKTGTTNDNYDAWFIGFSSNLVVGVYIGFDNPRTLGKFETGSKAALPIFKNFIENKINGKILGPVNAPIFRIKKKFRIRLLIRGSKSMKMQNSLAKIIPKYKFFKGIKLSVDVDPINFN